MLKIPIPIVEKQFQPIRLILILLSIIPFIILKKQFRSMLLLVSSFSIILGTATFVKSAPVRFDQVSQLVNVKPGQTSLGNYASLSLANDPVNDPKKDEERKKNEKTQQDDRVITKTTIVIVEDLDCECKSHFEDSLADNVGSDVAGNRPFPPWSPLLALGPAIVCILECGNNNESPSPSTPDPVPEPMTIFLFGTGLAGIGFATRRKFGNRKKLG